MTCIRYTLIALTMLIWISGSVSVGLGCYIMVKDMKFEGLTGYLVLDASILGAAGLVFIVGFFGCLGATMQKRNILKIFFILMAIFLLIQITLVIVYFVQKDQLEGLIDENWKRMTDEGRISIQLELECCGMRVSEDTLSFKDPSCFSQNQTRRSTCFKAIEKWLDANLILIAGCGGGTVLIEMLTLILTCLLIREIGRETTVVPFRSDGGKNWSMPSGPHRRATGLSMAPRPIHPSYDDDGEIYMEDYEEPAVQHTRKEWARQNYRQEWRTDKKKR